MISFGKSHRVSVLLTLFFVASFLGVDDTYSTLYNEERFFPPLEILIRGKAQIMLACLLLILLLERQHFSPIKIKNIGLGLVIFQIILATKQALFSAQLAFLLDALFGIPLLLMLNNLASRYPFSFFLKCLQNAIIIVACCHAIQALHNYESMFVPFNGRFTGLSANPNHIGASAALSLILLAQAPKPWSFPSMFACCTMCAALIGSESRTALIMLIVTLFFYAVQSKKRITLTFILSLFLGFVIANQDVSNVVRLENTRLDVISETLAIGNAAIGYRDFNHFKIPEGFWLYSYYSFGFLGLLYSLILLFQMGLVAIKHDGVISTCFLALLVGNFTESIFSGNGDFKVVIFLLMTCLYSHNSNRQRALTSG